MSQASKIQVCFMRIHGEGDGSLPEVWVQLADHQCRKCSQAETDQDHRPGHWQANLCCMLNAVWSERNDFTTGTWDASIRNQQCSCHFLSRKPDFTDSGTDIKISIALNMNFVIITLLACVAIVLSAVALSRASQLSLPLPSALPILNIAIPLLAAVVWSLSQRFPAQLKQNTFRLLLPYLARVSNLAPFALLILSLVFAIPSDVQYCATDRHWLRMFELKDETSIRSIQNRLQCCGLNSLHDRAWPFPSRNSNARACENTQHYSRACGSLWRHEEVLAAGLTAISSFLNWIVLMLLASGATPRQIHQARPAWTHPQHLLEGQENQDTSTDDTEANINDSRYHDSAVWNDGANNNAAP